MLGIKRTTALRAAAVLLLGALASCAATSPAIESRPSLAPGARATYRDFAREQAADIQADESAEIDRQLSERAELAPLLQMAFGRSPRILKARAEWKAAVEKVPQATALPDPSLTVLHYLENVETRVGPMENVFTFTQKIPWPAKLVHAGDVAAEGARIAALRYAAAVRDVLVETKTAYYEYVYLTRAKHIVEQNVDIARRLAALGADQYSDDKALLIDVLKAQSQLAQLDYDLITLTELLSAERTRINALLDRPPEAPLGEPAGAGFPRVKLPVEELYEIAARSREEIRIADRRIEMARAKERLAADQYAPNLSVGASYIQVDGNSPPLMVPADNGQDAYGIMLGVTIPLWVNRISAGVREARAEKDAAIRGKTEVWNRTFSSLKDAYFKLTNAERLVLLYRDSLIPQAKQVMLFTEERSREDRLRLGDYLEAQTVWLNFTLAMERALVDYNQAIARIERLTGAALTPTPDEETDR